MRARDVAAVVVVDIIEHLFECHLLGIDRAPVVISNMYDVHVHVWPVP